MLPHPHPDAEAGDEAASKKLKVAAPTLLPEADFIAQNPGPCVLTIIVPAEPEYAHWGFTGQTFTLEMSQTDTVQQLKERISVKLGIPANKQKLKVVNGPHLNKDTDTIAKSNIRSGSSVEVGVKERGGKKK